VDYVLVKNIIIFVEVKIGKDKESNKQTLLKGILLYLARMTNYIKYYTMTENNYMDIIQEILGG
jgi:transcriptional antiterminator